MVTALAALSGLAAYAIFSEAAQGTALDARVRSLTTENATLTTQIAERRQQIGEANNKDWLEEQARRLGFVYPGESVFIITTPNSGLPAGGGINAALPTYVPPTATPAPSTTAVPSPAATATPAPTPLTFFLPSPPPNH